MLNFVLRKRWFQIANYLVNFRKKYIMKYLRLNN